ncbi:adenylate/guanylate cyclase domain-containing protein [Hyalangium versicolor]|uniref:adenylate/guanylate cyclase domain-containing protein n=1 Tax=Hyalangium versicolor TaxID=2861190 RepID=UPI001CC9C103|nr:adenylate/guanylate cyclase domain-containing protein [Hyalangium versicolor]
MKTANLAIVFTDIQGFTERTSRQTHEENQRLLRVHHDLLAPLFTAFGGKILKSIGDAFLVTFESPTQAVLSGVAIQDRLWHYNRTVSENEQLHVRVAINVGEVRVESQDVFGEPVNIAARVEGITDAGEVFFTEAVYLSMNKAEVPSQEVGAFELKGIPGKIRVFRVPKGPYRMEAPVTPVPAAAGVPQEGPPFANMALSRVSEQPGSAGAALSAVGQRAAVVGVQARGLASRWLAAASRFLQGLPERLPAQWRSRVPPGVTGRRLALGLGGLALVLGVAVVAFGSSPAERAIDAVREAPPSKRDSLTDAARKLIREEAKNPERAEYLYAQLSEARGDMRGSVEHYVSAVKAGSSQAKDRIIELLEHKECGVRQAAVLAVAVLKLKEARGELEDLAEQDGPEEGASSGFLGTGLGGCNSRRAAQEALKRLGDD